MHREVFIIIGAMILAAIVVFAAKPTSDCTAIRSGEIIGTDGNPITTGASDWGYNYQAHRFSGEYCLANELEKECPPGEPYLKMRWNDAWVSNKDCDGDFRLDTHYGFPSYRGSDAWLLMEQDGEDVIDGAPCDWTLDMELLAVPLEATLQGDFWVMPDGEEVGLLYFGDFALVKLYENNECTGAFTDYRSKYNTNVKPSPMPKNLPKEHPMKAAKK